MSAMIRCDICTRRHRPGSALYFYHLAGRDPDDLAEPTRTEMSASARLAEVIASRGPAGARGTK